MPKDKKPGYWDNYNCNQPSQGPYLTPDGLPYTAPSDDQPSLGGYDDCYSAHKSNIYQTRASIDYAEGDIPLNLSQGRPFSLGEISSDIGALRGEILAGRRLSRVGFSPNSGETRLLSGKVMPTKDVKSADDTSLFLRLKRKYSFVGNSKRNLLHYLEGLIVGYGMVSYRY